MEVKLITVTYACKSCREGGGVNLTVGIVQSSEVLEEQETSPEKIEEGEHRCSKRERKALTLPPPSAPQRAFSAPLERAGALARAPFEPQPQQRALLQPLAWAQQATVALLTMLRL